MSNEDDTNLPFRMRILMAAVTYVTTRFDHREFSREDVIKAMHEADENPGLSLDDIREAATAMDVLMGELHERAIAASGKTRH